MVGRTLAGALLMYGLVASALILLALSITPRRADHRHVTRSHLVSLAEQYVALAVEGRGEFSVTKESVSGFRETKDIAVVSLYVGISNGASVKEYSMNVVLHRGSWNPVGFRIITVRGAPPIGVPAASPN